MYHGSNSILNRNNQVKPLQQDLVVAFTVLLYKKINSGQVWFKLSLNKNSKQ